MAGSDAAGCPKMDLSAPFVRLVTPPLLAGLVPSLRLRSRMDRRFQVFVSSTYEDLCELQGRRKINLTQARRLAVRFRLSIYLFI